MPDARTAYFDVSGHTSNLDLGIVAPHIGAEDFGLIGKLEAQGALHGRLDRPSAHATFALHDGHFRKLAIDAFSGVLDTDGRRTDLTHALLRLPFASTVGDVHLGPGDRINGSVDANAADLAKLTAAFGLPNALAGSAGLRLSIAGSASAPRVVADLDSRRSSVYGVAYDSLVASVRYAPGEVEIGNTVLDLGPKRGRATLSGSLPLRLAPFGLGPKNRPVNLQFAASGVDLAAFNGLVKTFGTLGGSLNASLSARGTAGNPDLAGSAQLRGGEFAPSFERAPLRDAVADLTLAHDTVSLTRFHGTLGRGAVDASGAAHVVPAAGLLSEAGLQYSAHLRTSGARIDVPSWITGAFDSDLSLVKSGSTPFLSGTVTMNDGNVPFAAIYDLAQGFSGGAAPEQKPGGIPGVPPLRPGHTIAYGGAIYGPTIHVLKYADIVKPSPAFGIGVIPDMDLDVTASAGRNVHVKGGAIDLNASGKVRIAQNLRSPTLEGSFHSTRGQVTYFDTVFRLRDGTVTFAPSEGLLPTLDVVADTQSGDERITVAIRGRVDNLNTDFSASPPLTRDQIVATLLHAPQVASVFAATPDQAQTLLTNEAQNYFNAQLTRSLLFPFESALAETLNIQQISFLFDARGNVNIEVRTKVTPTVYALYRSTLSVPVAQTFGVAYALRDYTSLNFTQTTQTTGEQLTTAELRFTFK